MATPPSPIERFRRRVAIDDPAGCWLWTGYLDYKGYAPLSVDRHFVKAHRFSYELFVGPIPPGLTIDHLCRVRHCVNPAHLEPVTARINTLRGVGPAALNAAKTHCPEGHPLSGSNLVPIPGRSGRFRRGCRTCRSNRERRVRQRRAAEVLGVGEVA